MNIRIISQTNIPEVTAMNSSEILCNYCLKSKFYEGILFTLFNFIKLVNEWGNFNYNKIYKNADNLLNIGNI